jgi:WD40 repeat protein
MNKRSIVYSANATQPHVFILDGITGKITAPWNFAFTTFTNDIAFSPGGGQIAFVNGATPFVHIYNTVDFSKVSNPPVLPAGVSTGVSFNNDSTLLAVAHQTTPFITVYDTATWAKLANPSVLPSGTGQCCAFNPSGTRLAVGTTTTPFIEIYDTTTWTKIAAPAVLPPSTVNTISWSPDGSKIALATNLTPVINIYNTADMSKVANPPTLPANSATGCRFSPDGTKLAVSHISAPFLRVYKVSDWTSFAAPTLTGVEFPPTTGNDVVWLSNTELALSTSGLPGIIYFDVGASSLTLRDSFNIPAINNMAALQTTGWKIDCTIIESKAATDWIATAYDYATGAIVGQTEFTGTTFTINVGNPDPVHFVVLPKIGTRWQAVNPYGIGAKVFPTNAIATPFYYAADNAGTSGVSEPAWPTAVNSTVVDGTITWRLVERVIRSRSQYPVNPIPV